MSKRPRLVRGARKRPIRGRLLTLEALETREAPGSVLTVDLGGRLFAPFANDPFAASEACSVCQHWTGALDPERGRSSSKGSARFSDGDGPGQSSEKDGRRATATDSAPASGTARYSFDTGLFGDLLTIPGFGSGRAEGPSASAAVGKAASN